MQPLANGTTITRTFIPQKAHDSEGRTYSETQQTLHVRADGQPIDLVSYIVFDSVARTRISWENRAKIANVTHMPVPETMQDRTQPVQVPDVDAARQKQVGHPTEQQTREDLGVRTIACIVANGTRSRSAHPVLTCRIG